MHTIKVEGITRQRADELLAFLPWLSAPGQVFVLRWAGGEPIDEKTITMSVPVYAPEVLAFFRAAGQRWWMDHGYRPQAAAAMLADQDLVDLATIEEIQTLLTYCVRCERFGDGSWERLLVSGRLQAVLRA